MSTLIKDLEGFLSEISDAVGSTKYYDDIIVSVEGIERIISGAEPSEQGARRVRLTLTVAAFSWTFSVPAPLVCLIISGILGIYWVQI